MSKSPCSLRFSRSTVRCWQLRWSLYQRSSLTESLETLARQTFRRTRQVDEPQFWRRQRITHGLGKLSRGQTTRCMRVDSTRRASDSSQTGSEDGVTKRSGIRQHRCCNYEWEGFEICLDLERRELCQDSFTDSLYDSLQHSVSVECAIDVV